MHRSGSTTRVSDEFFSGAPTSNGRLSLPGGQRSLVGMDQLPRFNPQSDIAKKESSRLRSAENAIHLIPLVLILCALVLWFFSTPHIAKVNEDVLVINGNTNVAVVGLSNEAIPTLFIKQEGLDDEHKQVRSQANRSRLSSKETGKWLP